MEIKKSWKLSEKEKEKVVELWLKGKSTATISKIYNVNDEAIRLLLKYRIPKEIYNKVAKKHKEKFFETTKPMTKITKPRKLNQEFAWWLGALKGDGYVNTKDNYVRLEVIDREFRDRWAHIGSRLFSMSPKLKFNDEKKSFIAKFNSKMLVQYLQRFGKFGKYIWDVPDSVMRSDFTIKINFLKGVFDAEGSVKGTPEPREVTFTSVNKTAASDVNGLLRELGIKSKLRPETRKNGKTYQIIRIGSFENMKKFAAYINFSIPRKSELLDNYLLRMHMRQ